MLDVRYGLQVEHVHALGRARDKAREKHAGAEREVERVMNRTPIMSRQVLVEAKEKRDRRFATLERRHDAARQATLDLLNLSKVNKTTHGATPLQDPRVRQAARKTKLVSRVLSEMRDPII
eukprot:COSAG05_NODE_1332_length_5154_cov_7.919090_4_plen_121_part_00